MNEKIDFTQPENAAKVAALMTSHPETFFFSPEKNYVQGGVFFTPKQPLLAFSKPDHSLPLHKKGLKQRYLAVASDKTLGAGATAEVREIVGVWKITPERVEFKVKPAEKTRVLKSAIYKNNTDWSRYEQHKFFIKNEQGKSQRITHLAAKYPSFDLDRSIHLLLRKQPGKNLLDFIEWQEFYPNNFSVLAYLLLCRNLFQSYAQQIYAIKSPDKPEEELVHRDIKPENIIFDPSSPTGSFNFIDFAFATFKKMTKEHLGSPIYMPPDHYLNNNEKLVSKANDIFALILIGTELSGEAKRTKFQDPSELTKHNTNIDFPNLFKALKPCTKSLKKKIRRLWSEGTRFAQSTRDHLTPEIIINKLNQFITTYCQNMTAQHPYLNFRLNEIKGKLNQYHQLSLSSQQQIEIEFLAVEYLNDAKNFPIERLKENHSLHNLWTEYRNNLLTPLVQKLESNALAYQPHALKKLQAALHYANFLNPAIIDALYQELGIALELDNKEEVNNLNI
ncbi:MAG: hypothetical protein J0I93_09350 [Legionella sp.]|nr:hypothetical protein [Legionella sp.]